MPESTSKQLRIKCAISAGAIAVIVVRALWPNVVKIDPIAFGLLMVAILPWLSSVIKSAEFPGGWKIEFQEIQKAGDQVIAAAASAKATARRSVVAALDSSAMLARPSLRYSFVDVMDRDPNLALTGLRIEIERRLRMLAEKNELPAGAPLGRLLTLLHRRELLTSDEARGLKALIDAGNSAAHGADVAPQVANWAIHTGPEVLGVLDAKLKNAGPDAAAIELG